MRRVFKWLGRGLLIVAIGIAGLLAPVVYTEVACIGAPVETTHVAILTPDHHRAETRTLMTYPEWHIVHAYDDYARVIAQSDPHDFGFMRAIGGFWSSLCALSQASGTLGEVSWDTKQMVYVIGVSFTAELLAKAAYEETVGRVFTVLRGASRAPLDDLSADQARAYAGFLQQVPWYRWDFAGDAEDLATNATPVLRDRERRFALGLEYRAKATYARVIEQAVAQVGADALRLRMIVAGLALEQLRGTAGVDVVATHDAGIEIETPRYRELTHLLADMAGQGAEFVEIAGNDDILFTATGDAAPVAGAVFDAPRQGYGDTRHLILVKVADLAQRLRTLPEADLRLEHVHDY